MNDTKPALPEPHEDVMRPGAKWLPYDEAITYAEQCTAAADARAEAAEERCNFMAAFTRDAQEIAAAAQARIAELEKALNDAAKSLNTIATRAGHDEYLSDMTSVRGYAFNRCNVARAALASTSGAEPADPMDMPLPCDVKIGGGTHRKGTSLRTLVTRMKMLHEAAFGPEPTQEQMDANLAVLQGRASPPVVQPEAVPHSAAAAQPGTLQWRLKGKTDWVDCSVEFAQYLSPRTDDRLEVRATPPAAPKPLSDTAILDMAADFRSQYMHGGVTFEEFDALGFARAYERALAAKNGAKT